MRGQSMRILNEGEFADLLEKRSNALRAPSLAAEVAVIIDGVRRRGDEALAEYARRFDGVESLCQPSGDRLEVLPGEFEAAYERVDGAAVEAIRFAVERVRDYHGRTLDCRTRVEPAGPGMLGRIYRPVDCAGLYIPGGRKPYISTVIMTAVPARAAGVRTIVACTPPRSDGAVDPHILVACRESGVGRLFKVGGAQAIAAMAYGTETIPKVDKVAGPGNRYVTAAKRLVHGDTGIDSLAGPSEVAILADESANPDWVAGDLLAQAEHGAGSMAALFSASEGVIRQVDSRLTGSADAEDLDTEDPDAEDLHPDDLQADDLGVVGVVCRSVTRAIDLINKMAPEHLQVMTAEPLEALPLVRAAGAILIGGYSPAALGDYVAGPSHVLPTGGAARFSSGLTPGDFMISSSLVWESKMGMAAMGEMAARLADLEGFTMHARALRMRLGEPQGPIESGVGA